MHKISDFLKYLAIPLLAFVAASSAYAQKKSKQTENPDEPLPPVVVHEGLPYIIIAIIDETEQGGDFSHQATSNDEFPGLNDGISEKPISGLSQRIVNWRIEPDSLREQVLHRAFDKALQRSKLRYAYSMVYQDLPRKEWVPQINMRISEWKFRISGAAECIIEAEFFDASGKLHDLKGSIGFESTEGMTNDRYDLESYLQTAAQYAFEKVLRNVKKKRLYREPEVLPVSKKEKSKKKK